MTRLFLTRSLSYLGLMCRGSWDIHHGNGTQDIFADDPRVLYVSIHMYNNAWEYPMSSPASIVSGSSDYVRL